MLVVRGAAFQSGPLPETNIFTSENGWLEDDRFLLGPGATWQVRTVSFRECTFLRIGVKFDPQTAPKARPSGYFNISSQGILGVRLEVIASIVSKLVYTLFTGRKQPTYRGYNML